MYRSTIEPIPKNAAVMYGNEHTVGGMKGRGHDAGVAINQARHRLGRQGQSVA
jgi:hypothetical protein